MSSVIQTVCVLLFSRIFEAQQPYKFYYLDPSWTAVWIPPTEVDKILFAQIALKSRIHTGATLDQLYNSMKTNGFDPDPKEIMHLVEMKKGVLTSLDNRRLAVAQDAGVPIHAIIHQPTDKVPVQDQDFYYGAKDFGTAVRMQMEAGAFQWPKSKQKLIPSMIGFHRKDLIVYNQNLHQLNHTKDFSSGESFNSLEISEDYVRVHGN